MKTHVIFVFLVVFSAVLSGQNYGNQAKNKPLGKPIVQPAVVHNMVPTLEHDTCLDKKFSIVFYLFQDTAQNINVAAITSTLIAPMIIKLNTHFKRICVTFESCSTVVIPNSSFGTWNETIESVVTANWYTENTINLYIPNNLVYTPCITDYAYIPNQLPVNSRLRNIVVSAALTTGIGNNAILHAMGHFFGLPHTSAEINPTLTPVPAAPSNSAIVSREYVTRNPVNCAIHGDGFCDTDADPGTIGLPTPPQGPSEPKHHIFCDYMGGEVDVNGEFYTPPFDNFMSAYVKCMCRYSQEQYNFMARYILKKRLYLH